MKDKDLDVAFIIADEDKSGGVDLDEFLNLYKLIKKGEVVGLGALSADARTKKRQFKVSFFLKHFSHYRVSGRRLPTYALLSGFSSKSTRNHWRVL
jgi:hypothetical protein